MAGPFDGQNAQPRIARLFSRETQTAFNQRHLYAVQVIPSSPVLPSSPAEFATSFVVSPSSPVRQLCIYAFTHASALQGGCDNHSPRPQHHQPTGRTKKSQRQPVLGGQSLAGKDKEE
jgi:hypothetical protein